MGGEIESEVNGWTLDTLHVHVERLFIERDLRYQQRFDAQQDQLTTVPPVSQLVGQLSTKVEGFSELMNAKFVTFEVMVTSQAEKVALALASADKAVTKAEVDFQSRVADLASSINLLRELMGGMVRSDYLQQALDALGERISRLEERNRELELARSSGVGGQAKVVDQRASLAGIVGVAAVLISLIVIIVNIVTSR